MVLRVVVVGQAVSVLVVSDTTTSATARTAQRPPGATVPALQAELPVESGRRGAFPGDLDVGVPVSLDGYQSTTWLITSACGVEATAVEDVDAAISPARRP